MSLRLVLCLVVIFVTALFAGCAKTSPTDVQATDVTQPPAEKLTGGGGNKSVSVLMVPKIKGTDYFNACERGAKEAADELGGVDLVFDGPTEDKVDAQIQLIEGYIAQDTDVIIVSPNDPDSIAPVLKKARDKGIHVLTFDADASPEKSGREFFINQASEDAVGKALVDEMADQVGEDAPVAIITASLTAANQNAWIREMKAYMAEKYPKMKLVSEPKPSEEDQTLAFRAAQELLKTYPELKGIFALSSVALPGAADAVQQAGASGKVAVVGLATPKPMKQWVEGGTVKTVILWNPVDLGYLAVQAAKAIADGKLASDSKTLAAGRLGEVEVRDGQVLLGAPMRFTKENIAQFDF